jgi:hypothetical protein
MNDAPAPAMWLAPEGLAVGWLGPLGPAVAWLETWARDARFTALLGRPGAHRPVTPIPWIVDGGLVAFWCEDEGAFAQRLEPGRATTPALLLPGAARIALAAGPTGATLFGADDRGLLRRDVDASGRPVGELRRTLTERQPPPLLAATRLRDTAVLVHAYPGSASLGVLSARGADEVRVKHPLRLPCRELALSGSGTRATVVLGLDDGSLEVALLGAEGVMVERPHRVLERVGARLESPRVTFRENAWVLLVRDADRDRLLLRSLGGDRIETELPDCRGRFAARYWSRHFFALEASPGDDGAELRIWRCAHDGGSPEHRIASIRLLDAPVRRVQLEARTALTSVVDRLARGQGYRDEPPRAEVRPDGASLSFADREGHLSLSVHAEAGGVRLAVTSALGHEVEPPEVTALVRLARWIRERVSTTARAEAERDRSLGVRLAEALGGTLVRIDRAGGALALEIALERVPAVEMLAAWVRQLRAEQGAPIGR